MFNRCHNALQKLLSLIAVICQKNGISCDKLCDRLRGSLVLCVHTLFCSACGRGQ
jgi:hypothetical protein